MLGKMCTLGLTLTYPDRAFHSHVHVFDPTEDRRDKNSYSTTTILKTTVLLLETTFIYSN